MLGKLNKFWRTLICISYAADIVREKSFLWKENQNSTKYVSTLKNEWLEIKIIIYCIMYFLHKMRVIKIFKESEIWKQRILSSYWCDSLSGISSEEKNHHYILHNQSTLINLSARVYVRYNMHFL